MGTKPHITNLEQATETSRGHRRKFDDQIKINSILDSVTNAIILIDQNGLISFVNHQTKKIFGYERDELLGQKIEMLLPGRFRRRHIDLRKEYNANPTMRQMGIGLDLYACRKDGTEFPCEIGLSPLKTADGDFIVCGLHDISKRKHAEDALLESRRLAHEQYVELDHLYSTAPVGLAHMDIDLRYIRCNEKLAEINGIPVADHIGRTLREIVPEIAETMEPVYRKVIETGEAVIDIEASMLAGDDPHKLRYFSACYYPLKTMDGVVTGVSSIVQEITERKEAEKYFQETHDQLERHVNERTKELKKTNLKLQLEQDALVVSEQRLRRLVESTNAIPWEANALTWQFTYIGPQAIKLFGYSIEQWYEKDFWVDHIHPKDRDYVIKYCQESSQHSNEYEFDYRMIAANGNVVWLHDIVHVERINGDIKKLRGFIINISKSKKVEKTLQRYKHIVNASDDIMVFIDADYICRACNQCYLDAYQINWDEIIDKPITEVIRTDYVNVIKKNVDKCLAGEILNYQMLYEFPGTGNRYVDIHYYPHRDEDGTVAGVVVSMHDISERKQAEDELRIAEQEASMHRERLAHLIRVQTLGEMASGIAHEINQPLAAIESYAQAGQRRLRTGKANPDKVEELLGKISGQARRAGSVVSRLRAMMQRRTVNPIPIDINMLLGEVTKIAEIDTKHHDCRLILKLCPSLPNVICDEIQIQQVALNLIRNAIDAMEGFTDESKKEIIVETKRKDDKEVEISITDNGPGISELDAGNIFEAFYTTKDSGLGMGLSICHNIINAHGGEIGFSRSETGGEIFYFTLPAENKTG